MKKIVDLSVLTLLTTCATTALAEGLPRERPSQPMARGVVFEDRNENGRRDRGERGIPGVMVSNGRDVVRTGRRGRYRLPVLSSEAGAEETVFFVTKPSGYDVPVDANNLPQFYYIHYPKGTPSIACWNFEVIQPTGPLPRSVDFPLLPTRRRGRRGGDDDDRPGRRGRRGTVVGLAFADPQMGSLSARLDPTRAPDLGNEQLSFFREDFVNELVDSDADFAMVAGDIINDDLDLYPRMNALMAKMGIPVWNSPGNHDLNFKSPNQRYSTQTYINVFGPDYYSFDYGDTHFVALNNVFYKGNLEPFRPGRYGSDPRCSMGDPSNGRPDRFGPNPLPDGTTVYRGQVPDAQLEWLAKDLSHVPRDKLIVIFAHIPFKTFALSSGGTVGAGNINTVNLRALLDLVRDRPRVYSFSGHDTSNSWQVYLGPEEGRPAHLDPVHHQVLAEVRGPGWRGPFDERGVRLTDMEDGNPNGYYRMTFGRGEYSTRFKAAFKSPAEQMRISVAVSMDDNAITDFSVRCPAPDDAPVGDREWVVANVYDGGPRNLVEMSLDGGRYVRMEHMVRARDVTFDGITRPAGSAWCLDPFMGRHVDRIEDFVSGMVPALSTDVGEAAVQVDLINKFRTSFGGNPSGHLWRARIPVDLAPGVHTVTIRSTDQYGQVAKQAQVFEVCPIDFADVEVGLTPNRDCYVLDVP